MDSLNKHIPYSGLLDTNFKPELGISVNFTNQNIEEIVGNIGIPTLFQVLNFIIDRYLIV